MVGTDQTTRVTYGSFLSFGSLWAFRPDDTWCSFLPLLSFSSNYTSQTSRSIFTNFARLTFNPLVSSLSLFTSGTNGP